MRKPLSYFMYFKSHKKSSIAIAISVGLAIFLIGAIQLYVTNMSDTNGRGDDNYGYMTAVYEDNKPVTKDVLDKIQNEDSVDKVIKVVRFQYMIRTVLGTDSDFEGFYADENDIKYMMDKIKVKFDKGNYVKNGDNKILINENAARFKKVSIGDFAGNDVRKDDYFPGKYKINGILKGDNMLSFIAVDSKVLENQNYRYLVFPKKGKMAEMNKFIKSISKGGVKSCTRETMSGYQEDALKGFDTVFNLIIILMIVVMSTVLGNSSYINYMRRRTEIGILKAMGYTREKIILRMVKEMGISSLFGFGFGYLVLFIFEKAYNSFYLYSRGLSMFHVSLSLFPKLLAIPLFITIFSIIPVSRLLEKVEPISIIERVG